MAQGNVVAVGCTNNIVQGGVCKKHGAKRTPKICGQEGCNNQVVQGGVCVRHGAVKQNRKKCGQEGCTTIARNGFLCQKHITNPVAASASATTTAAPSGVTNPEDVGVGRPALRRCSKSPNTNGPSVQLRSSLRAHTPDHTSCAVAHGDGVPDAGATGGMRVVEGVAGGKLYTYV